ncbi:hypothetical protein KC207_10350 [Phycicoccus sp. BSK3Z-2]|uniref:O-antigen ligase domain-containing protein n=1 Tax=Phycicoccus avicenniae TaxID=2828860 RepID=A0A941I136_9MICO|nr:hypothetical protein [Phycicoccus avicenniae]MBR7743689.1 hypothetical protein [Phycicoccus avicenniae]
MGVRSVALPPWWPLAAVVYGYPLWWLLGVAAVVPLLAALVMLRQLWRTSPVVLPRGATWWLLFLVWVVIGVATLWVDAPDAVPGGGPSRIVPFAYRLAWYATCTVVLLWIANSSRLRVPTRKVVDILAWMFVIAAFGGLAGVLLPTLELRSVLELLLPGGVRGNAFVQSLVHPGLADVQTVLGRPEARPKAPFPYANTWGSVLALSLPFFVVAWVKDAGTGRRWAAVAVLVVAAVPTVYSLNRGLWACLVLGLVFLGVLQAWRGRPAQLVATVVVVAGAVLALALSPLGSIVSERFDNQHSNERRSELLVTTVNSAAEGSPVVGFGSTRDVQGSFASIAGGGTPSCPACEVPPLGTQGHLWFVVFAQGLVGALFFVTYFTGALLASLRCRTITEVLATVVLLFFGLQLFVYDTLGIPLLLVMVAIGLAWRDQSRQADSEVVLFRVTTVTSLLARVAGHRRWWVAAPALALAAGLVLAALQPPRHESQQAILLKEAPSYLPAADGGVESPRETTVDTEAALVMAERTMRGAVAGTGVAPADLRQRVRVTAVPSTRVIVLQVTAGDPQVADDEVVALAGAYLAARQDYLAQRRDQYLARLRDRQTELVTVGGPDGRFLSTDQREELAVLGEAVTDIVLTPTSAGEQLRLREAVEQSPPYDLYGASGLGIGILVAAVATALGRRRSARTSSTATGRGRVVRAVQRLTAAGRSRGRAQPKTARTTRSPA